MILIALVALPHVALSALIDLIDLVDLSTSSTLVALAVLVALVALVALGALAARRESARHRSHAYDLRRGSAWWRCGVVTRGRVGYTGTHRSSSPWERVLVGSPKRFFTKKQKWFSGR